MRTLLRVGGILGGFGFVALYATQAAVAVAVVPGIPLVGMLAGLSAAKWLPREWYGRQLRAGLRAGALASGLAALGALFSLLLLGPRDTQLLAARSHIADFTVAPVVRALAFLTWVGADLLLVVVATGLGCGLAAIACQVAAWSKSADAIRVVQQARLAAQALNRDDAWLPRPTGAPLMGQPMYAGALLAQPGVPALGSPSSYLMTGMTGAPALSSMPGPISGAGSTGAMPATGVTPGLGLTPPLAFTPASGTPSPVLFQSAPAAPPSRPAHSGGQELASATEPALSAASPAPAAASPTQEQGAGPGKSARQQGRRRSPSSRRRADEELTHAMREALAAWASENTAGEAHSDAGAGASRAPAPSAYLNSAASVATPKRGRKKQDTRDWLC